MSDLPNIVLVHGAWADGSSWAGVIRLLQQDGYDVVAPQFPLTSLADNVARLREVLRAQSGPTVVAGHSYGGQIMTALGNDAPHAVALVYVAGFGLDEGESIGALLAGGEPTPALAHLRIELWSRPCASRRAVRRRLACTGSTSADVDAPITSNVLRRRRSRASC